MRREELDGEVFEILLTFSDFLSFKEMFIDYKAVSERMCWFSMLTDGSINNLGALLVRVH